MTKQEIIKKLNQKIDKLILDGKKHSPEYKRLCQIHKRVVFGK